MTVQTSVDGVIWKLCADLGNTLSTSTLNSWVDVQCQRSTVAKYVKVNNQKDYLSVCEIELFGYKAGTVLHFYFLMLDLYCISLRYSTF